MKLSDHFDFNELTSTSNTSLLEQNRADANNYVKQLKYTAGALEEIRTLLGVPLTVTSGFRNNALNKAVGGSATSKHREGLCADFKPNGMTVKEAFAMIQQNKDKLHSVRKVIVEGVKGKEWIHVQSRTPKDISEKLQIFSTNDGKTYSEIV